MGATRHAFHRTYHDNPWLPHKALYQRALTVAPAFSAFLDQTARPANKAKTEHASRSSVSASNSADASQTAPNSQRYFAQIASLSLLLYNSWGSFFRKPYSLTNKSLPRRFSAQMLHSYLPNTGNFPSAETR